MGVDNQTEFKSIAELHKAYRTKSVSVVEVTRRYLAKAKADKRRIFLHICEERALQQAQAADEKLASEKGEKLASEKGAKLSDAALFGVPIAIKDAMTLQGVVTTCGSKMLENYIPPYTATVVKKLEDAGAIIIGKTNMDEFAMGSSNENSAFGSVIHPTHPDRVPGGSSGGSAAAVKAGYCLAALGSDTGGSIRLPASYCGVIGLKPTYGRASRFGLVAFASSLDQIGPMALNPNDLALVTDVITGYDEWDSTSSKLPPTRCAQDLGNWDWKKIRIGVPAEYFVEGLAPDVEKAVKASLDWFASQGAQLVPVTLPHTKYSIAVYYVVAVSEASSNLARFDGIRFGSRPKEADLAKDLAEFYEKVRVGFGAEVKRRIILGTFALSSGYSDAYFKRACQVRRLIQQDFDHAFKKVDFIVGPVAPTTAFKLGEKTNDPLKMYLNDIYTVPASLAGIAAASIPCGIDRDSLPIGLHVMAPQYQEERLLKLLNLFWEREA